MCLFLHHPPPQPFHPHFRPPHPGWRGPRPPRGARSRDGRGTGSPTPQPGPVGQGKKGNETVAISENKKAKPGSSSLTPEPGIGPGPGGLERRGSEVSAISETKTADLVDDLRTQLAKLTKEKNDIEKERDVNDEMVTTLKGELEKYREEAKFENLRRERWEAKYGKLCEECNQLVKQVQLLGCENMTLMKNSVQQHFIEFLKKEEGIVDVDQYILDNYQMAIPKEVVKEVEVVHQERAEKKAKESENVQLEDLAFKSTNAFHKLTKQIQELKKKTSDLKKEAEKKEESYEAAIEGFRKKLIASQSRVGEMEKDFNLRSEQKHDEAQLQKLNVRVDKVQKELKEKEKIIKNLTEKMKEGFARDEEDKKELEAKIEKANIEHKAEISELEGKIKRLKEELEKNEEHLERSYLEIQSREEQFNEMKKKFGCRLAKELNRSERNSY